MKKKYIICGIMALMTMLVMGVASAAHYSWHIPNSTDKVLDNNDMLNISFKNATETEACNITFTSATSGSGSTTVVLANLTGGPGNTTHQFMANQTWNIGVLKDASDYVLGAVCRNASGTQDATVTNMTGVTIDSSTPSMGTNPYPTEDLRITSRTDAQNLRIHMNCTNATSATLYVGNSTSYTMTESNDNCTYNSTFMWADGVYMWKIVASDGTNSTDSGWYNFTVSKGGSTAVAGAAGATGAKGAQAVGGDVTIAGKSFDMKTLFIVAAVALLLLEGKKRSKKKKSKRK